MPKDRPTLLSQLFEALDQLGDEARTSFEIRHRLLNVLSPPAEIRDLHLVEVIDAPATQALIEDFYAITHVPASLLDLEGGVVIAVGWQDICTQFHRQHPESCAHCIESDTHLSGAVPRGEWRLYKCKNGMWDVVTPVIVGETHVGNLYSGQFFFEGDTPDREFFRAQARRYGFSEKEYMAALDRVPRLDRETLNRAMSFYLKLADLIGRLSFSNIRLARTLVQREALVDSLRASEEQFRRAIEEAPIPVIMHAEDGQVLQISRSWTELTGYTMEDASTIVGWLTRAYGHGAETVRDHVHTLFSGGEGSIRREIPITTRQGETRYWSFSASSPGTLQDGRRFVVGMAEDITERKLAEEALQRYGILANRSRDVILFIRRTDGRIIEANMAATAAYGYTRDELLSTTIQALRAPQNGHLTTAQLEEADARGILFETVHLRRDGSTFPVEVNSRGATVGGVRMLVSIIRDITDRKRTEEALRHRESMLGQVGQMANLGAWEIDFPTPGDMATSQLRWFDEVYRIFGYTPGEVEVTNELFFERVHPEDRQLVREAVEQAIKERQPYSAEHRIIRPTGEERVVWEHASIEFDASGQPVHLVGAVQDITDRKRTEEALRRARQEAEAASGAKSEFLARMSHELRTPLHGIMGMVELVAGGDLPPREREYLGFAKDSGRLLLEIINDVLDLSRIEAGRVELHEVEFDLRRALASDMASLAAEAARKNLRLTHSIDAVPDRIRADRGRIEQILFNIVGNALKFTDEGEVAVRVDASQAIEPSGRVQLLFEVQDTGIGIAPDRLAVIFQSFEQAGGASHHARYGGAGLGLAISHRLARMMGGAISVESDLGRGSTFRFTVPVEVLDVPAPPQPSSEGTGAPRTGRKLKVLLAEDNPVNQLVGKALLEREGHSVVVAADGRKALDALAQEQFDLVLMDVRMPELNGDEATKLIREGAVPGCPTDIPIVALTAHALVGDRERFLAAGMDGYLPKPIDIEQFRRVLAEVTDERRTEPA